MKKIFICLYYFNLLNILVSIIKNKEFNRYKFLVHLVIIIKKKTTIDAFGLGQLLQFKEIAKNIVSVCLLF